MEDDDPPRRPDDVVEEVDDEDAELGGEGEAEDEARSQTIYTLSRFENFTYT